MLLIMASDPCPHYGQRKKKFILMDECLIRSVDDVCGGRGMAVMEIVKISEDL